jgi:Haem-binding domain
MKMKIVIGLLLVLLAIQFFKPEKNTSGENSYGIHTRHSVPENVNHLLVVACNDCHSNKTIYPWYSNIQPASWWLNKHVVDGKKHLNFSTFTRLPIAVQNHKFEEVIEMIEKKEMPLASYTYLGLRKEADLSDEQRKTITEWAKAQMNSLRTNYPPDSLVLKRKAPPATSN